MEKREIEVTNSALNSHQVNCEEIQEIITAVPSWILKRGILVIFLIIVLILVLSAFIQYPDVVKVTLKVNSLNSPKSVYAKQTGKIATLLVKENEQVKQGESLAFMESTADHNDVLKLRNVIASIRDTLSRTGQISEIHNERLNLGELQGAYQSFHQQYLLFISTQNGGYYLNRKQYLENDLKEIEKLKEQIVAQKGIQEQEFRNIEQEFYAYKKLYIKNVISNSEYKQQENKYLSAKYPMQQTTIAMLNNSTAYAEKQKEILELDHTIQDEKAKFVQSLNNLITEIHAWCNQYMLVAPVSGTVIYAGIVQENQTVATNQEVFMINPANTDFFGEVQIPQYNMGKVRNGQRTLVKMRSYPFEQYGLIRGKINYISDVAFRDSVFIGKISFEKFENKDLVNRIILKNGMHADAEIITQESSLLQRFLRNFIKILNVN